MPDCTPFIATGSRILGVDSLGTVDPARIYFFDEAGLRGVDVQARTRAIIDDATSRPKPIHELVVRLFTNERSVRLVTTNFDRHLTSAVTALYPGQDIFIGPALPLGRDVSGITYLHGAVQRPSSRLVLTDRDFGQAYLADGWATRFLMEMFWEFTVLFVGYSHQDLVMCYLGDADAASDAPGDIVCDCITMGRRASRAFRRGLGASGWHTGFVSRRQCHAGRTYLGAERHRPRAYSQCVRHGR